MQILPVATSNLCTNSSSEYEILGDYQVAIVKIASLVSTKFVSSMKSVQGFSKVTVWLFSARLQARKNSHTPKQKARLLAKTSEEAPFEKTWKSVNFL
jgi:hypothetical protein